MAFVKKVWKARQGTGLNKFKFDGETDYLINTPDSVSQEGDTLTAEAMNDLEQRIADATEQSGGGFLAGTIVAFSGSFSGKNPIPKGGADPDIGWHICDGTDGTPDLRNKFIYGGDGSNQGTTGGSSTHSHTVTGTVGSHTLTTSEMPSHSHSSLAYGGSDSGSGSSTRIYLIGSGALKYNPTTLNTGSKGSGISHNHSFSSGSANSQSNIPPYYTLAYIIKL